LPVYIESAKQDVSELFLWIAGSTSFHAACTGSAAAPTRIDGAFWRFHGGFDLLECGFDLHG